MPAVHQIRDSENGEHAPRFSTLIGEQTQQLQDDVDQLYDNWFVETCDDWIVPYIGDLVGFRRSGAAGEPADAITPRGQLLNRFLYPRRKIANLVRRRRRKGTLSVLEDMAKDVTGWSSRAVEFSRLVAFFQNVKHPQPRMGRTFSIRENETHPRVNTPFDRVAHTIDVKAIQPLPGVGWYHPKKVGLFVWRRKVLSATMACPCRTCHKISCPAESQSKEVIYYTFNRVGIEAPIYVRPVDETDELHIADESNLPVPLYRHLLADQNGRASDTYYGVGGAVPKSLAIYVRRTGKKAWSLIPGDRVIVTNLCDSTLAHQFQSLGRDCVAVDPERGILVFGCKSPQCEIAVSYHYAATMEMGGGEYDRPVIDKPDITVVRLRNDTCSSNGPTPNLFQAAFDQLNKSDAIQSHCQARTTPLPLRAVPSDVLTDVIPPRNASLAPAVTRDPVVWILDEDLCIEITESNQFQVLSGQTLYIEDNKTLIIRGARGAWPLIRIHPTGSDECPSPWHVQLGSGSVLVFDGLLISGVTMQIDGGITSHASVPSKKAIISSCRPCESQQTESSFIAPEVHLRHTTFVPGGRVNSCLRGGHASVCLTLPQAKVDDSTLDRRDAEC